MDHPALSINTSGFWSSSEGTDVCLWVISWTATQHVRANSRWSPAGSPIEGDSMAVPALCATRAGIIVMSVLALAITACTSSAAEDSGDQPSQVGNVIFLHPDGTGLNSWNVARAYWKSSCSATGRARPVTTRRPWRR
jgi:hypothetical protein